MEVVALDDLNAPRSGLVRWAGLMNGSLDHRPQAKSLLASVTFAQELLCLNRAGSMLRTTNQWQDHKILIFFCRKNKL